MYFPLLSPSSLSLSPTSLPPAPVRLLKGGERVSFFWVADHFNDLVLIDLKDILKITKIFWKEKSLNFYWLDLFDWFDATPLSANGFLDCQFEFEQEKKSTFKLKCTNRRVIFMNVLGAFKRERERERGGDFIIKSPNKKKFKSKKWWRVIRHEERSIQYRLSHRTYSAWNPSSTAIASHTYLNTSLLCDIVFSPPPPLFYEKKSVAKIPEASNPEGVSSQSHPLFFPH